MAPVGARYGWSPAARRGRRRHHRHGHVVARRHRVAGAAPGGEGVGPGLARHPEGGLHLRVVRLQVVVLDRPVRHVGTVQRSALAEEPEVLFSEPGELGIGVHAAPADRRRQVVDLTRDEPVAVVGAAPVGPRLEQRVRPEQMPAGGGDLVVGEVAQGLVRRGQVDQVVAPLLEDHDRPPGRGEHVRHRGSAGTRADDDDVAVGHDASRAGGKIGSGKPDALPPAAALVAAVGGVAIGGLAGVGVEHPVVARFGGAVHHPLVHGPQLIDALAPGVALPGSELEPAGPVASPCARRRPEVRRLVVERAEEALDVVDRAQRGRARHLLVEGRGDAGPLLFFEHVCHYSSNTGVMQLPTSPVRGRKHRARRRR